MKRMTRMVLAIALTAPGLVSAYFVNGTILKEWADANQRMSSRETAQAGQFLGYVQAAYDAGTLFHMVCPPEVITPDQVVSMVSKYLNAHPGESREPGVSIVLRALREAFPCSAGSQKP